MKNNLLLIVGIALLCFSLSALAVTTKKSTSTRSRGPAAPANDRSQLAPQPSTEASSSSSVAAQKSVYNQDEAEVINIITPTNVTCNWLRSGSGESLETISFSAKSESCKDESFSLCIGDAVCEQTMPNNSKKSFLINKIKCLPENGQCLAKKCILGLAAAKEKITISKPNKISSSGPSAPTGSR